MEISHRRVFFDHAQYAEAWSQAPRGTRWFGRERVRPEVLGETAHFLAGALLREGFHLFQNGGLPLLERRSGDLVEEIVIRPAPAAARRGLPYLPVSVQLHLSHVRLGAVRRRYWRPGSRAPQIVASGDIGELELPPCWVLWNLGMDPRSLASLVEWTERLALPWFDGFHRPIELHGRLQDGCIPLVRTDTALELMLAHYGHVEASLFLERKLRDQEKLRIAFEEEMRHIKCRRVPVGFDEGVPHNLAVVATTFRLLAEVPVEGL